MTKLTNEKISQFKAAIYLQNIKFHCVASSANLWAFILDSGTGYSSQVCDLSSNFLRKSWIMEQWKKNYHISSIAGANNDKSLVVMSQGTNYTQQSYKITRSFPYTWINKKWRDGFHVTSMATAGSRWCVVMSTNSCYSDQVPILRHF
ncbi:unnamed protein product [Arabis nemorensis]|uniref:DUF7477 domain-containing protein n=1 Tax=Arabis nemorensis TaxID=586526 RepID=A0A565BR06_9BRAS|nr:unnamed protein product [Arabis nemorensis]